MLRRLSQNQLKKRGIERLCIDEEFRQLAEFPRYYISNYGRIYSTISKKLLTLKPSQINGLNYYKVSLSCHKYRDKKGITRTSKQVYIHRLVYETYCTDKEVSYRNNLILHVNHNTLDNSYSNLVLVSRELFNIADDIREVLIGYGSAESRKYKYTLWDIERYTKIDLSTFLYNAVEYRDTEKTYFRLNNWYFLILWRTKNKDGKNRKIRNDRKEKIIW